MATIQQQVRVEADEARDEVWSRRVRRLKRRKWKRRLINAFIVWQIFVVAVWLLPGDWPVVRNVMAVDRGPVRDYMVMSGFQQSWQMYAPNPDDRNIDISVTVTYKDKTQKTWVMPRLKNMSDAMRYRKERLRKWAEVGTRDAMCWYPMARFGVRQLGIDPHNPPVSALLSQTIQLTPPPGQPRGPAKTTPLCIAIYPQGVQ